MTISLPSKEVQLPTEVAFVLDESSFSDTYDSAINLLENLKNHVDQTDAKVQIDIIGFKRAAYNHGSYDLKTQYDLIKEAFKNQNSGGSNMHAGFLLAKEILAQNTAIPDDRKYLILVSDGDTYLYCKNENYNIAYSRSYVPVDKASGTSYGGFYDESWFYPSRPNDPYEGNVGRPSTGDPELWEVYLQDVNSRNNQSKGDTYDFVWKFYDGWKNMSTQEITADGFKTQPRDSRTASNMDMAFWYAANTYKELAAKYHCYSIAVQSLNKADGGHPAFMEYLNGGQPINFSTIQNEILYFLGKGSKVIDYIGYEEGKYNYDLVDPSTIQIIADNVNGKETTYNAILIEEGHYGFNKQEDGTYSYEIQYVPANKTTEEHLVWVMNVPVTNFEHISLKYRVKLVNPQTEPGTYTTYTNNQAILYPVDSQGIDGNPEYFEKPMVQYTVKASEKTNVNTKDKTDKEQKSNITKTNIEKTTTNKVEYPNVSQNTTTVDTAYTSNKMIWEIALLGACLGMIAFSISRKKIYQNQK